MTRHPNLLSASDAVLIVVDIQEAFVNAIPDYAAIVGRSAVMIQGARELGLPIIVTEQVPTKLGRTVEAIRAVLPPDQLYLDKTAFSSCGAAGFEQHLAGRKQVLLCGNETHVCINQTAHDLLAMGCQVHLLADAIGSRAARDREAGLAKMYKSGAIPSSVEMALFELMRDAKHECFRAIQKLVK